MSHGTIACPCEAREKRRELGIRVKRLGQGHTARQHLALAPQQDLLFLLSVPTSWKTAEIRVSQGTHSWMMKTVNGCLEQLDGTPALSSKYLS
jgi:hypothetical protein